MPPRDWRLRVQDILEAIAAIEEYTRGMDYEAFTSDRKTVDAVLRNLTVIGEAATYVPDDIVALHPEVPWREMRDMRNVVVHAYFGVNTRIVWDTIQLNLHPLIDPLQRLRD